MRVALDATPLLGQVTGVGRYTGELLAAFARLPAGQAPEALLAAAFTWRGHADLAGRLPPSVHAAGRRAPARLLAQAWLHVDVPTMAQLGVKADLFHGTNFVLPPPGRGAVGVVTIHDLAYLRMPENVSVASARYRNLVPRGLRRARMVLTPTQAVADEVVAEYGLPADRVRATHLGVDPVWFQQDTPARPGLPERYLLFVGALEPRKDVATLLAAFRQLRREQPDTPPLVLVGPQGWGPALDTSGLTPQDVIRLGYLDTAALQPVVAHAAALCYPSLYEGFGLPPLEAIAAGTPVVASDIPAVREVIGGGGPGVRLVPVRDVDALTWAIAETLAASPDPEPGRAHAQRFTWERTANETMAVYRRASS
jgi:glycosyltransferase involved in cell wall biosynthesis